MKHIAIRPNSPPAHHLQEAPENSLAHSSVGTQTLSPPEVRPGIIPASGLEGEFPGVRQYRIYSIDLHHLLSTPLHDNNDGYGHDDNETDNDVFESPSNNNLSINSQNTYPAPIDSKDTPATTLPPIVLRTELKDTPVSLLPLALALSSGESLGPEVSSAILSHCSSSGSCPGSYDDSLSPSYALPLMDIFNTTDSNPTALSNPQSSESVCPFSLTGSTSSSSTNSTQTSFLAQSTPISRLRAFGDHSTASSSNSSSPFHTCTADSSAGTDLLEALGIVQDFSSLNRSDLEEIHRHEHLLEHHHIKLLNMVKKKVQLHPQRYDRDDYLETSSFLILSNSPSAQRYAFCGIPSQVNRGGSCRLHQFCPYCCWRERTRAQLTYVPSFSAGTWHFLTGSSTGQLTFSGSNGYDWLHYWDAWKHGFEILLEEELIRGVYWVEELAVVSFLPTCVLPHVHAIVEAEEISSATVELLRDKVTKYLASHLEHDFLPPSVKLASVDNPKSLLDRIGYLHKPMKLLRPYRQAWTSASFHNRVQAWRLNSELTDLMRGHSVFTRGRPKMKAKGVLNSKTKNFIGVKKDARKNREHQALINQLKREPVEFFEDIQERN